MWGEKGVFCILCVAGGGFPGPRSAEEWRGNEATLMESIAAEL